ncbi:MAG TPA: lasso RiPP family leader peptide-containing protein [Reyranella sp.]|jgi:hypothetical protein|nr:lasso RiPP family leader peptide-containing protein [Reyranella sp.]
MDKIGASLMGRTKDEAATASPAAKSEKKPYEAPALIQWGTLRDLTLAVGSSGASDFGGKKSAAKATH